MFLKFDGSKSLDVRKIQSGDPTGASSKRVAKLQNQFLPTHGDLELQILLDRKYRKLIFRNPNLHLDQPQTDFDTCSLLFDVDDSINLDKMKAKVVVVACVLEGTNSMRLEHNFSHCPLSQFKKYTTYAEKTFEVKVEKKAYRQRANGKEQILFKKEVVSKQKEVIHESLEAVTVSAFAQTIQNTYCKLVSHLWKMLRLNNSIFRPEKHFERAYCCFYTIRLFFDFCF